MILPIIMLFSCNTFDASLCIFSQERLEAIQHQRKILKDLRSEDRLGKKKADIIESQLAEEEELEKIRMKKRCTP